MAGSYTHLTLPTNREGEISGVSGGLKKKEGLRNLDRLQSCDKLSLDKVGQLPVLNTEICLERTGTS